jgi:hypothetical protein
MGTCSRLRCFSKRAPTRKRARSAQGPAHVTTRTVEGILNASHPPMPKAQEVVLWQLPRSKQSVWLSELIVFSLSLCFGDFSRRLLLSFIPVSSAQKAQIDKKHPQLRRAGPSTTGKDHPGSLWKARGGNICSTHLSL